MTYRVATQQKSVKSCQDSDSNARRRKTHAQSLTQENKPDTWKDEDRVDLQEDECVR